MVFDPICCFFLAAEGVLFSGFEAVERGMQFRVGCGSNARSGLHYVIDEIVIYSECASCCTFASKVVNSLAEP